MPDRERIFSGRPCVYCGRPTWIVENGVALHVRCKPKAATTCRYPCCTIASWCRGLCHYHYGVCSRAGTLEEHALPAGERGSWKRAAPVVRRRKERVRAAVVAESDEPDEPRGEEVGALARRIAEARAATAAERALEREETLARLEREAARAEAFA